MSSRTPRIAELWTDSCGTSIMEFGLMAAIFVSLLLGLFDLGQMAYTRAILDGAVQEAARTSALETGDSAEADARIQELVRVAAPGAIITTSRKSYFDFADLERAESWSDSNGNDTCDNDEIYTDENDNGIWDEDIGVSGNGSAGDVVIYSVEATYDPIFPNPFFSWGSDSRKLTASAIKKNQPFADQESYGATARACEA